jgi:DNA gyrase subunit A
LEPGERVAALLAVREWPAEEGQSFVVMGTRLGVVKKTDLKALSNPRVGGIIAISVEEGDSVIDVQQSDGRSDVFLGTREGMAIRFPESDVRSMGRAAYGVRGISLREQDEVVAMEVLRPDASMLIVTENGYGKRTTLDEYRVQSRGGVGIINIQTTERNGRVVGVSCVTEADELMLMTEKGKILRMEVADMRLIGRNAQGVKLIDLEDDDRVVSVARLAEGEGDPETEGSEHREPPGGSGPEGGPPSE